MQRAQPQIRHSAELTSSIRRRSFFILAVSCSCIRVLFRPVAKVFTLENIPFELETQTRHYTKKMTNPGPSQTPHARFQTPGRLRRPHKKTRRAHMSTLVLSLPLEAPTAKNLCTSDRCNPIKKGIQNKNHTQLAAHATKIHNCRHPKRQKNKEYLHT